MNNSTTSIAEAAAFISGVEDVQYAYIAQLALLTYTTILAIPREVEYVWLSHRPFSIPNLCYALTRYGSLVCQVLYFWLTFVDPGSLCNNLVNVGNAASIMGFAGVQGLLITRAYSLCGGNRIITVILAILYLGGLVLNICRPAIYPGCVSSYTGVRYLLISIFSNVCSLLTDLVVFCVCLWKVWGTWKLKRDTGIQSNHDLVSVLLRQAVSRFCFVVVITVTFQILFEVPILDAFTIDMMSSFQRCLSAILLADFTLDLRQQNSAAIQAVNETLPTIQFRSVVNYIHQSILVEMGSPENPDTRGGEGEGLPELPDTENQREESIYDHIRL